MALEQTPLNNIALVFDAPRKFSKNAKPIPVDPPKTMISGDIVLHFQAIKNMNKNFKDSSSTGAAITL